MTLISTIMLIMFLILLAWTWNSLGTIEKKTKIILITCGILAVYILTLIIFSISKIGITYPKAEMIGQVRKIAVLVFTPINGFLSLPHIASLKMKIKMKSEEDSKLKKKIIILGIIFIVATIVEINYMKNFQNGIIQILNSK